VASHAVAPDRPQQSAPYEAQRTSSRFASYEQLGPLRDLRQQPNQLLLLKVMQKEVGGNDIDDARRRRLLEETKNVIGYYSDVPMHGIEFPPGLATHKRVLIEQSERYVWPAPSQPARDTQHEYAIASSKIQYCPWLTRCML
jgi:hypothetical protein